MVKWYPNRVCLTSFLFVGRIPVSLTSTFWPPGTRQSHHGQTPTRSPFDPNTDTDRDPERSLMPSARMN